MIGVCTLGLSHFLTALGAFLAGVAIYDRDLAPSVFYGDGGFAYHSPHPSFAWPKENFLPPTAMDFVNLYAWASVFNHSVHHPPSPLPTITVASSVMTVTVTETTKPTFTAVFSKGQFVYPDKPKTAAHSAGSQAPEAAYTGSSGPANSTMLMARYFAHFFFHFVKCGAYLAYTFLILECQLWQRWQMMLQQWHMCFSPSTTDSGSSDNVPHVESSSIQAKDTDLPRSIQPGASGPCVPDASEEENHHDHQDPNSEKAYDTVHQVNCDDANDKSGKYDGLHTAESSHPGESIDADEKPEEIDENDTSESSHCYDSIDAHGKPEEFDANDTAGNSHPFNINDDDEISHAYDTNHFEEDTEQHHGDGQSKEPDEIVVEEQYPKSQDDPQPQENPSKVAVLEDESASGSIIEGAPDVDVHDVVHSSSDCYDDAIGAIAQADECERPSSSSISIGALDDEIHHIGQSCDCNDTVAPTSIQQEDDPEVAEYGPRENCQTRSETLPFDTNPEYFSLYRPRMSCWTFAQRGKVWVTIPGHRERIIIKPQMRVNSQPQAPLEVWKTQQNNGLDVPISRPTVAIPSGPYPHDEYGFRVPRPNIAKRDKDLSVQSRDIFPSPGLGHRQKRGAAKANRRARAAAAQAPEGGASSGGEADVDDDDEGTQNVQGANAADGNVEEREPREDGVEGESPQGQEVSERDMEATGNNGEEDAMEGAAESQGSGVGQRSRRENNHQDLAGNKGPDLELSGPQARVDTPAASAPTATEPPKWQSVMRDILASGSSDQVARTPSSTPRRNPNLPSMPRSRGGQRRPPQPPQPRSNQSQNAAPYAPAWLRERFNAAGCPLRD